MENSKLTFRQGEEKDTHLILTFIKGIAAYEKMSDQVAADEKTLKEEIFVNHRAEVIFAVLDGKEIGFALYFFNFSTFVGHSGLYLEDLFIFPEYRHCGYGKRILIELAKIARKHNCGRMDWVCLNWNQPSINFYESLGAKAQKEWLLFRLDKKGIDGLAEKKD